MGACTPRNIQVYPLLCDVMPGMLLRLRQPAHIQCCAWLWNCSAYAYSAHVPPCSAHACHLILTVSTCCRVRKGPLIMICSRKGLVTCTLAPPCLPCLRDGGYTCLFGAPQKQLSVLQQSHRIGGASAAASTRSITPPQLRSAQACTSPRMSPGRSQRGCRRSAPPCGAPCQPRCGRSGSHRHCAACRPRG